MLVVVAIVVVGRYLYGLVANDVRDKKAMLAALEQEYHHLSLEYAAATRAAGVEAATPSGLRRLAFAFRSIGKEAGGHLGVLSRVVGVSEAVADVEYAVRTDEAVRRLFAGWLKLHIVLSAALLGVLTLHVVSNLYYGVRWLHG
jgi:hypothetical protein